MLYTIVLTLHNLVRWIIVIFAIFALARALMGWLGKRPWTDLDRKAGVFFGASMDSQFLLGLLLYIFLSPLTRIAFQNFGAAMSNSELRFFTLEHILSMIVATVLVHVGSRVSQRATSDVAKHRLAAIFYALAVAVILFAIPWSRPLFRFG